MIYSLTGKVSLKESSWVVLEVGGVGYKVYTNPFSLSLNEDYALFIYEYIRENRHDLFGFASREDLKTFESLLDVNGVGPKMALALVSSLGSRVLVQSLQKGDAKIFTSVPGVGQKLANKIVVELKGKVDTLLLLEDDEISQALESLGYKKNEIARVHREIPDDLPDTASKIKWALKNLQISR